jgi:alpha-tubulin suppressor-like RCC1 family protein
MDRVSEAGATTKTVVLGSGTQVEIPRFRQPSTATSGSTSRTLGLAVGGNHGCICLQDNELRCWGINDKGQLGLANTDTLGDNEPFTYVAAINLGTDSTGRAAYATVVGAGWAHTCAVLNTGIVRCWGANADGQLGLGYINGPGGVDFVGGTSTTIPALLDPVHVFGPSN